MRGQKGADIVGSYEKICKRCGKTKVMDEENKAASEWYTYTNGVPKPPCKECQNDVRNERRQAERDCLVSLRKTGHYMEHVVTVVWCPRNEWPRMRFFNRTQFRTMLNDGVCTPGMCVTQHDKQYIVWGPKGDEQWMTRL